MQSTVQETDENTLEFKYDEKCNSGDEGAKDDKMRNDLQCPDSVEVCLEEDILVQRRDEKKLSTTRSNLDEKLSREDS